MEQLTNYNHKILLNNTSLIRRTIVKSKPKKIKCTECNRKRMPLDESHQICHVCYKIKRVYKRYGKLEYVPYEQFKNIEFIAEGGFSKIYKATWIDGPVISYNNKEKIRSQNYTVVLKKINNSKNITSKELNELKVFYDIYKKRSCHYLYENLQLLRNYSRS
ncbi:unnamed protein product [Rhizophagus irregularis]|nr:unnamed protein product [Rhizophagus irregularis]